MSYNPLNPNGQATSANSSPVVLSTAQEAILTAMSAKLPAALGQTNMAGSLSVTIASNQTNIPTNLAQVNGGTVVTVATGVQKVGIADSAGTGISSSLISGLQSLNVNLTGSTNITTGPSYNAPAAGAITANGQTVALTVQAFTTIVLEISGTYGTGLTLQFEQASGSGSGTFFQSFGQPINGTYAVTPVSSVALTANQNLMFQFTLGANVTFRVRASAWASPSGSASIFMAETTDTLQYGQTIGINNVVATSQSGTWTFRIVGNAGATLDSAVGAGTAPTNQQVVGLIYNSTEISPTTGQAFAFQGDSKGRLRNVIMDAAGNTRGVNVTSGNSAQIDITSVAGTAVVNGGVAGSQSVGGTVATNVAITANPLNLGAQAVSSENSAVTTARQVQLVADLVGKLITLPYANPENFVMGTTAAITDTTSTSTIASAGGSLRNYVTQITVTNSHATVGTFVKILDGATIIHEAYAAAAGGGFTATFPVALRGTAATAVNTQPVTTGANVIASVSGYKGV